MLSKQYIAGFLDGEGYFGIMRRNCNYKGKPVVRHVITIKVAQRTKDEYVLKEIQKQFGGRLEYRKFPINKNMSDATSLCFVNHIEVKRLLDAISKYLIVKKQQSEVLKNFLSLGKLKVGKNTKEKDLVKEKLFNDRESLYANIIKLNRVGRTCRD